MVLPFYHYLLVKRKNENKGTNVKFIKTNGVSNGVNFLTLTQILKG